MPSSCSLQGGNASTAGSGAGFTQTGAFLANKTTVRKPARMVKATGSKMNHMSMEASIKSTDKPFSFFQPERELGLCPAYSSRFRSVVVVFSLVKH